MTVRLLRCRPVVAAALALALITACTGGSGASYGSNDPGSAVSTTISGKSDTSGVSAGAAFQAPGSSSGSAPSATPTRAP